MVVYRGKTRYQRGHSALISGFKLATSTFIIVLSILEFHRYSHIPQALRFYHYLSHLVSLVGKVPVYHSGGSDLTPGQTNSKCLKINEEKMLTLFKNTLTVSNISVYVTVNVVTITIVNT